MRSVWESLSEIDGLIRSADHLLLGLDFDGTLTPICPRPDDVTLADSVRNVLALLARRPRTTLAIVSGRGLADVAARVGLPDLIYAGNHGMEIDGPGLAFVEPNAAALTERVQVMLGHLYENLAEIPGCLIEPKGLTASVHYRNVAPELHGLVERAVHEAVAFDPERLRLTTGQCVWEIRPRVAWNKGKALLWILDRLGHAQNTVGGYIGDDRTDEDAFSCLPNGLTIRVGSPVATHARYAIADPGEVERFLVWLLSRPPDPTN